MTEQFAAGVLAIQRPSVLAQVLREAGFSFKKQLGQNFLVDQHVLDQIIQAANLTSTAGVLEVGPGAGVVTQRLAAVAGRVVAVEKDASLRPVLERVLAPFPNVEVVYGDFLQVDLAALWREHFEGCDSVRVIANLPYYVTTPILFRLLEAGLPIAQIIVMVQREVADRMAAKPGGKDFGALTLAVQYYAEVERILRVPPGAFMPSPDVESAVVRLTMRVEPPVSGVSAEELFRVVRAAFSMRRKTLLNNLSQGLGLCKPVCTAMLEQAGIAPVRRGETLSLEEFAAVARAWKCVTRRGEP
ncbi:MAG: 16S rRNA (adenine(1518)-N(6)/adenine(1519)-N(6))-dimethyltransferase RsmA [Alicyclobacillus sp.]|nr:16S rRNA (adenine(1518)-N(6)/adenine(1519)-N(6))-dimethyltransferase RsmA [Alicyclobacillus sp.]